MITCFDCGKEVQGLSEKEERVVKAAMLIGGEPLCKECREKEFENIPEDALKPFTPEALIDFLTKENGL